MHHERRRHERLPVNFYVEQVPERRREAPARIQNDERRREAPARIQNDERRREAPVQSERGDTTPTLLPNEYSHRYFAADISLSGVYIEQPRYLQAQPSTFLQLHIPLPGAPAPISVSAEVVFARKDLLFRGSGLRFVEMSPIHTRWLREWIHEAGWTDRFLPAPHSSLRTAFGLEAHLKGVA